MKHLSIFFIALAAWCAAGAQAQLFGYKDYNFANQVNVGKGSGQVTNPAAWLEIGPAGGGTKGILMPRGDRHAITSPVFGLVIYDTNDQKFYYYNGNSWQPLGSVDPTLFVQNQNSQAQTANFWINGSGRMDGGLTLGGVLKHAQLAVDPTGTNGMVYYLNSTSPGLRTFTNSTWKYVLTGTSADGSGDFIKNQTASQQSAGFNVGNGFASKLGVNTSAFISNEKLHVQGYVLFDSSLTIGVNTPGHEIYLTNGGSIGSGSYLSFVSALGQNVSIGNATYNNVFTVSGSDVNIQPAGGVSLFSIGYTNPQKVTISGTTRIKAPVILDSVINIANIPTDPSSSNSNGQTYYNTTSNTFKGYQNGAWKAFLMAGDVGYITGNTITVDANAANATDTRTGLSKYNSFYPFKTISAAIATVSSVNDLLVVQPGSYSENVTSPVSQTFVGMVLNGATITGNVNVNNNVGTNKLILVNNAKINGDISGTFGCTIQGDNTGTINGAWTGGNGGLKASNLYEWKYNGPSTSSYMFYGSSNGTDLDRIKYITHTGLGYCFYLPGNSTIRLANIDTIGSPNYILTNATGGGVTVTGGFQNIRKANVNGFYWGAGGRPFTLDYLDNCNFSISASVQCGATLTIKHISNCEFINNSATLSFFDAVTTSLNFYNCKFQTAGGSLVNSGSTASTVALINLITNNSTIVTGSTPATFVQNNVFTYSGLNIVR